jgi:hypothetical protein
VELDKHMAVRRVGIGRRQTFALPQSEIAVALSLNITTLERYIRLRRSFASPAAFEAVLVSWAAVPLKGRPRPSLAQLDTSEFKLLTNGNAQKKLIEEFTRPSAAGDVASFQRALEPYLPAEVKAAKAQAKSDAAVAAALARQAASEAADAKKKAAEAAAGAGAAGEEEPAAGPQWVLRPRATTVVTMDDEIEVDEEEERDEQGAAKKPRPTLEVREAGKLEAALALVAKLEAQLAGRTASAVTMTPAMVELAAQNAQLIAQLAAAVAEKTRALAEREAAEKTRALAEREAVAAVAAALKAELEVLRARNAVLEKAAAASATPAATRRQSAATGVAPPGSAAPVRHRRLPPAAATTDYRP